MTKECTKCTIVLPLEMFSKQSKAKDGYKNLGLLGDYRENIESALEYLSKK